MWCRGNGARHNWFPRADGNGDRQRLTVHVGGRGVVVQAVVVVEVGGGSVEVEGGVLQGQTGAGFRRGERGRMDSESA